MSHRETDLFGDPLPATVATGGVHGRKIGYADRPGSGPKGQRCNTCVHFEPVLHKGRRSHKCLKMAVRWTAGEETDIKPRAPACRQWERKPFRGMAA